jgi:hypothetical protein
MAAWFGADRACADPAADQDKIGPQNKFEARNSKSETITNDKNSNDSKKKIIDIAALLSKIGGIALSVAWFC